jgi:thiol-disulfide isomerase/thioredoxin
MIPEASIRAEPHMRWLPLLVVICALVVGCASPPPAASGPAELTDATYDTLDAALKEREGSVVLVDFWATWCGPCRARFPHFVETHKKYKDKGLVCMSVSMDLYGPGGATDRQTVLDFLKSKGATFPNFLVTSYKQDAERIGRRFGFDGSLPHVVLFGRGGKKVWDAEQRELSDRELDKLIESELK